LSGKLEKMKVLQILVLTGLVIGGECSGFSDLADSISGQLESVKEIISQQYEKISQLVRGGISGDQFIEVMTNNTVTNFTKDGGTYIEDKTKAVYTSGNNATLNVSSSIIKGEDADGNKEHVAVLTLQGDIPDDDILGLEGDILQDKDALASDLFGDGDIPFDDDVTSSDIFGVAEDDGFDNEDEADDEPTVVHLL